METFCPGPFISLQIHSRLNNPGSLFWLNFYTFVPANSPSVSLQLFLFPSGSQQSLRTTPRLAWTMPRLYDALPLRRSPSRFSGCFQNYVKTSFITIHGLQGILTDVSKVDSQLSLSEAGTQSHLGPGCRVLG